MRFFLNPTPIILLYSSAQENRLSPTMRHKRWVWGQKLKTTQSEAPARLWIWCQSLVFSKCWCNTIMKIPRHKQALFQRAKSLKAGYFLYYSSSPFLSTNWAARIEALYCSDTTKTQKICRSWTLEWPKLCNTKRPHAAWAPPTPGSH